MSMSNYQYLTDLSALYQVTLPDDFAVALGLTPATGLEPYLPSYVSPRTVTYQTANGVFRSAVCGSIVGLSEAPAFIVIGSTVFSRVRTIGEVVNAYLSAINFLPSGPVGPPGPAGAAGPTGPQGPPGFQNYKFVSLGTNYGPSSGGETWTSPYITPLATGTWLVQGTAYFTNTSGSQQLAYFALILGSTGSNVEQDFAYLQPGESKQFVLNHKFVLTAGDLVQMRVEPQGPGITWYGDGYQGSSNLWGVQVA